MLFGLIIIIAVINYSKSQRSHFQQSNLFSEEADKIQDIFESIADIVFDIDEELKKSCRFESVTALDRYDQNGYTRKMILAGFNADTVSVKIKQRVMYTNADHLYTGRRSFSDIKILPLNLNTTEADYEIKDDKLYVNIPYVDLESCNHKVYKHVIDVPPKLLPEDANI